MRREEAGRAAAVGVFLAALVLSCPASAQIASWDSGRVVEPQAYGMVPPPRRLDPDVRSPEPCPSPWSSEGCPRRSGGGFRPTPGAFLLPGGGAGDSDRGRRAAEPPPRPVTIPNLPHPTPLGPPSIVTGPPEANRSGR